METRRESIPHRAGRIAVAAGDRIVNLVILLTALFMVLFATYSLWDDFHIVAAADASNFKIYSPTADPMKFADFAAKNPEVIGWITVPDTGIDYPLVQGDDLYYLDHSVLGEESLSGSVFLTRENEPDFSDFNSIIYGHHMADHKMFGDIDRFLDASFFDSHPTAKIYYDSTRKAGQNYSAGGSWKWHMVSIASVVECSGYDRLWYSPGLTEETKKAEFLTALGTAATHARDIGAAAGDHLIEMSTCKSNIEEGRTVLIGRIEP